MGRHHRPQLPQVGRVRPRSGTRSAHLCLNEGALEVRRGKSSVSAHGDAPQSPRADPGGIGKAELACVAEIELSSNDTAQVVGADGLGLMCPAVNSTRFERLGTCTCSGAASPPRDHALLRHRGGPDCTHEACHFRIDAELILG